MTAPTAVALREVLTIAAKYKSLKEVPMTLLEWISDIVIAELFDPESFPSHAVFEAKDAKLSYIPQLHTFNVLIYNTNKDNAKEVTLPLSVALEQTIGCVDVLEVKKNLKLMKSDCTTIAQEMQTMINDTLCLYTNTSKIFDC
tara:strand:- start:2710 stop:3138 length:429 start_codon:yes stop_codon:yes gene_type:complete